MKDHYNVLELEKNCTEKEIKDSYIKLSKKYHPDINKSKEAQKKILEINEAYSVLRNSTTRNRYDEGLQRGYSQQQQQQKQQQQQHKQENVHQNTEGYYYNRFRSYDDYARYYQKVNNQGFAESASRKFTLVVCCCMLMVFGAGLRIMYACSESSRRKRLNELMVKQMEEARHVKDPRVERLRLIFQKKHEREKREKKSEP